MDPNCLLGLSSDCFGNNFRCVCGGSPCGSHLGCVENEQYEPS